MKTTGSILCVCVGLVGHAATAQAQFLNVQPFAPQNRVVTPFGYGTVVQMMTKTAGLIGNAVCKSKTPATPVCLSISGAGDCSWQLPASTLISCNAAGKAAVNETPFAPVNCNGNLQGDGGVSGEITNADWCGWASYMDDRALDTVYQYNDYVRLGVNTRFGGTVFELYGTDKLDRIQQHPGGAMQMALYGDDLDYAPAGTPSGWFAEWLGNAAAGDNFDMPNPQKWDNTAFPSQAACTGAHPGFTCRQEMATDNVSDDVTNVGCANDGEDAGAGFNPVQGVSANCWYGDQTNYVDDIYAPVQGYMTIDKHGPYNYSKSDNVPGLFWAQTSHLVGPFAQLTYDIEGGSALRTMTPDFQELPAIFLHGGIGTQVYFYNGAKPYASVGQPVTQASLASNTAALLGFPPRSGQYGTGYNIGMTEDWASFCDPTGTQCITIASFSNDSQIIEAANSPTNSYFGIHGFFTLQPGLSQRTAVFIAPYRFDDVVAGKTVRQWVYDLRQHQEAAPAPVHGPTY